MQQSTDVNGRLASFLNTTLVLRFLSAILVAVSFVILHIFDIRQVGDSMVWNDGATSISAGSHPAILIWTAAATALFVLLMLKKSPAVTEGVPSMKRRAVAFLIDFWFSLFALSGVFALIPLGLEAMRTGHFAWQFQRTYSVNTDILANLSIVAFMVSAFFYFAFPLTRGRQTVGYFILGLRVTPPFGETGRFTLKAAVVRTFYSFRGLCSMLAKNWDRDGKGRTWYDRETNCTVRFVGND